MENPLLLTILQIYARENLLNFLATVNITFNNSFLALFNDFILTFNFKGTENFVNELSTHISMNVDPLNDLDRQKSRASAPRKNSGDDGSSASGSNAEDLDDMYAFVSF